MLLGQLGKLLYEKEANICKEWLLCLTYFMLLAPFYFPWKYQKISGFLMFSWGIEVAWNVLMTIVFHRKNLLYHFLQLLTPPSPPVYTRLKLHLHITLMWSPERHMIVSWVFHITLHKKWSFPLTISSVNVTKYAVYCGFGHIY